jgi:3-carboxy-cis,cis-muconate cycloisomerase
MPSWLIDSLATTDALAEVFSDDSILRRMLEFEARLALAQGRHDVIPREAGEAIIAAAKDADFDARALARDARESGTIVIPMVKALTARVAALDSAAARFVHYGATSQDVSDTVLALTLRRAQPIIAADHVRLEKALRDLSNRHRATVMVGRTLLQPAPPITLGLKLARYVAAIVRGWSRAEAAFEAAALLQFGGASGTLAALGTRGSDVARVLADAFLLKAPVASWHTDRDRLAAVATSLGIYAATLGKIARDLALLMQDEVGEAAEPGGGSSTMPHKRNPAGCAIALATVSRMPGLVAAYLSGMTQEHERAVGGWHSEWPTIAAIVQGTGAAVQALAGAFEQLLVDVDRMQANIDRTNGAIFAEKVVMLAAPRGGKEAAHALVTGALEASRRTGVSFRDALAAQPDVSDLLTPDELRIIDTPNDYLGAAEQMRVALLNETS